MEVGKALERTRLITG